MKPNSTLIVMVLDKSGSMGERATEVISGFNALVDEQRKTPGSCSLTLVQFDDEYERHLTEVDIHSVPKLTSETYKVRGWTALLDALGTTIDEVGQRLAKMPEHERPERVILHVVTDGLENTSRKYRKAAVAAMVKHQTDKYNWTFTFVGANQDAVLSGGAYSVEAGNCLNYDASVAGETKTAFDLISKGTVQCRSMAPELKKSNLYAQK